MKYLYLATIICWCIGVLNAQNQMVYDNFDDFGKVNWIFFDNNGGGSFNTNAENPQIDAVNTSDIVAEFTKSSESGTLPSIWFFFEKPIDLSRSPAFSMLVYGETDDTVSFTLQHNDLNYNAYMTEVNAQYIIRQTNTWEKAEFDFSQYKERNDFDKIVIEVNSKTSESKTIYLDDITGPEISDTARVVYARTSFSGDSLIVKFNKFMQTPETVNGFSLLVNGDDANINEISVDDSFEKYIVLIPQNALSPDDNISISYADRNLLSKDGWTVKAFNNLPVANATNKDTVLVWADEFEGASLDTTIWTRLVGEYWFNNESQAYTNSERNSYTEDGKLKITAIEEQYGTREYTSARIVSRYHADFRYGRLEASIKMPEGKGIWPAFWMMPTEDTYGRWPSSGEIDIMEFLGHELKMSHGAIHFGNGLGDFHKGLGKSYYNSKAPRNDDFHVYAIEWEPEEIRWYFDSVNFQTRKIEEASPYRWPFDQDFHFILNVAVGGNWPGYPDENTTFPQTLEVEYVRVYKYRKTNQTTGLNNDLFPEENKLKIFPNPIDESRRLIIQSPVNEDAQIYMFSTDGKPVQTIYTQEKSQILLPSGIIPGLYLIQLRTNNNVYSSKLIIW